MAKNKRRTASKKHIVLRLAIAALAFVIVINIAVVRVASPLIVTPEKVLGFADKGEVDCILVLGASVSDAGPSQILADRLDKGIELYNLGVSDILLLSGDNGTIEYNEVQAMKEYAISHGVGASHIYLDYAGFSTYTSAIRCKEVFQAKRVVIVTQRYHLYRAIFNAKRVGLDVVGVEAKELKSGQFPRDLREVPARVKDFFLTLFKWTPKIMGEPVPLEYPSTQ